MVTLYRYQAVLGLSFLLLLGPVKAADVELTQVRFEQSETGIGSYQSRLLLNDRFMRMDDGDDGDDFLLFDLESRQIHSINHEDRIHVLLNPAESKQVDFEIDFTIEKNPLEDAPRITGKQAMEYRFFANGQLCKKSINVSGLLPEVTRALLSYHQQITEQNKHTIDRVPEALKTACYMANHILHSVDYLAGGFPLMVIDYEGKQQRLLDFAKVTKTDAIFSLPTEYRVFSPPINATFH